VGCEIAGVETAGYEINVDDLADDEIVGMETLEDDPIVA
jgi:hypothetical protein